MKVFALLFLIAFAITFASANDENTSGIEESKKESEPQRPWGPIYMPGTPCIANKIFYSECNRCFCGKDGKTAGCTLMLCEPFKQIHQNQNTKIEIVD